MKILNVSSAIAIALAVVLLAVAIPALTQAQVSEVEGVLNAGSGGNLEASSTGSTGGLQGTVQDGNSLTGSVVDDDGGGGGGGGGGGRDDDDDGGGGGGGGSADLCPNIPDVQTIVPGGFSLVGGNCVQTSVGGETGSLPGVPNTGAGTSTGILLALGVALVAAVGGAIYFLARPRLS